MIHAIIKYITSRNKAALVVPTAIIDIVIVTLNGPSILYRGLTVAIIGCSVRDLQNRQNHLGPCASLLGALTNCSRKADYISNLKSEIVSGLVMFFEFLSVIQKALVVHIGQQRQSFKTVFGIFQAAAVQFQNAVTSLFNFKILSIGRQIVSAVHPLTFRGNPLGFGKSKK